MNIQKYYSFFNMVPVLWDLGIFQKANQLICFQNSLFSSYFIFLFVPVGLHRHCSLFVLVVGGFISLGKGLSDVKVATDPKKYCY